MAWARPASPPSAACCSPSVRGNISTGDGARHGAHRGGHRRGHRPARGHAADRARGSMSGFDVLKGTGSTRRIVDDPVLAERVGGLADVAGDRLQRLAGRADDQRQGDQRHHRPGGEEGAAEDRVALGGEGEEAEEALLEDQQAEDREHDARRAGDDLDPRLDRPREPRRAARTRSSQTAIPTPIGAAIAVPSTVRMTVPDRSGRGSRRSCSGRGRAAGGWTSRSRLRYWSPRNSM